jgi:hypothetical protein
MCCTCFEEGGHNTQLLLYLALRLAAEEKSHLFLGDEEHARLVDALPVAAGTADVPMTSAEYDAARQQRVVVR